MPAVGGRGLSAPQFLPMEESSSSLPSAHLRSVGNGIHCVWGWAVWAVFCSQFLVPEVIPEPQSWRSVSPMLVQLCLTHWDLPHL